MQPYVPPKGKTGLLLVGPVEAGKSTVLGHLIHLLNGQTQKYTTNYANAMAKEQVCRYAWIIDKFKLQKQRGNTIDKGLYTFQTQRFNFDQLQVSGHKDFLHNVTIQNNNFSCAILVVSTANNIDHIYQKSLIFDQADLINSIFYEKNLIVCVNKMDIDYSEERFKKVMDDVLALLGKIGFQIKKIPVIPVSGLKGDNILKKSHNMVWYKGPTLYQALDGTSKPDLNSRIFRFSVQDVYKIGGIGTVPVGRVESGILKIGTDITIAPSNKTTQVKFLEMIHGGVYHQAYSGDNMGFSVKKLTTKDIRRGQVIGYTDNHPPICVSHFTALLHVTKLNHWIKSGEKYTIFCHNVRQVCTITELFSKVDRRTGKIVKENPGKIYSSDFGLVSIQLQKPFTCETYATCRSLGKFFIKDGFVVGIGIVKQIFQGQLQKQD